jgi:hypothetical protein
MRKVLFATLAVATVLWLLPADVCADGFWKLDFQHTGLHYLKVGGETAVYTTFTVTNNTGADRKFYPIFRVDTETGKTTYAIGDPAVLAAVNARQGKQLLDINQICGTLKNGETKEGAAIFFRLDGRADRLDIYVFGLTNEFRYLDDANRKGFQQKVWFIQWLRPGDATSRTDTNVQTLSDGWIWRSTDPASAEDLKKRTSSAAAATGAAAPGVTEPKETLKKMITAVDAGDKATLVSCFDADSKQIKAATDVLADTMIVSAGFQKAYTKTFSKEMPEGIMNFNPLSGADADKVTYKVTGDKAVAEIGEDGKQLHFVKKAGTWMVSTDDWDIPPGPADQDSWLKAMGAYSKVMGLATEEVNRDGSTPESVQLKIRDEMMKMMGAMMPVPAPE